MKRTRLLRARTILSVVAAISIVVLIPASATGEKDRPDNKVLARQLAIGLGEIKPTKVDMPLSAGVMQSLLEKYGPKTRTAARGVTAASRSSVFTVSRTGRTQGCPNVFEGRVDNIRVNQDCSLRRQAEEWVGVNPRDSKNVVAGQNDSRIGFNHCGYDWSFDRGRTWGDSGTSPPPFWQMLFKNGDTSDACSDPAATFDHLGNVYVTGVFFDINSPASAIWVAKSNWPNGGAFYHTPQPGPFQEYTTTGMGQPASDVDPTIFHDKELMVADSRSTSLKKGRVYVTWTRFQALATFPFGRSPIHFSQSLDGGATWSTGVEISGSNSTFCTAFSGTTGNANACDQDQGSHPVVGRDGTIYVIFGNGNTPLFGINQVMMVKCTPDKACDKASDWTAPVKVGDLIGLHPANDPPQADPNGCPAFRQCLPPNGYRVPEFTSMSISVDKSSRLYATWADHRNNTNPNCEVPKPSYSASSPCDHDVFYAFSTDGGATWSPTVTVTPRSKLGENAQWQPWHDVMGDGSRVQVAFYDRHYGNCESTGCNDITLATISRPRSANPRISYRRITTSSMPNLTPATNPTQAGFLGDYMWVEVSHHNFSQRDTHIVWADTRPLPYRLSHQRFPEEDIYYARIGDNDD